MRPRCPSPRTRNERRSSMVEISELIEGEYYRVPWYEVIRIVDLDKETKKLGKKGIVIEKPDGRIIPLDKGYDISNWEVATEAEFDEQMGDV